MIIRNKLKYPWNSNFYFIHHNWYRKRFIKPQYAFLFTSTEQHRPPFKRKKNPIPICSLVETDMAEIYMTQSTRYWSIKQSSSASGLIRTEQNNNDYVRLKFSFQTIRFFSLSFNVSYWWTTTPTLLMFLLFMINFKCCYNNDIC